jgi:hypothetical protein
MAKQPETATEQLFPPPPYMKATVVGAARSVNTTFAMPSARTVVTTATEGIITLKYAPRDQPRSSGKTSS